VSETAQRYPLSWPRGWVRTPSPQRLQARFAQTSRSYSQDGQTSWRRSTPLSVSTATGRLQAELDRLGGREAILSTNVALRLDGMPRSDQREPVDPGAAVYFKLKDKPRTLACDRWIRVADNIAAIAAHIEAIRAVDRYGVGTLEQAFAGYAALPPATAEWWAVLGLQPSATFDQVEEAFRRLARHAHPDAGGSHDAMARLTAAREQARKALA
jgi:hypothetical protein